MKTAMHCVWLVLVVACSSKAARAPERDERPAAVGGEGGPSASARDAAVDAGAQESVRTHLDQLAPVGPPPPPVSRKFKRGDCKTSYAPRPDRDPNPMCRVEGGTFMYGGGTHVVNDNGSTEVKVPAVETTVRGFLIDQFEVTAAQAAHFLNAHGNVCEGLDQKQNPGDVGVCVWLESRLSGIEKKDDRFIVRPGFEHVRQRYFSWEGAMRYCAWVGKRVPSSAQWELAARHDPATQRELIYPWGNTWRLQAVACNAKECVQHPGSESPSTRGVFAVGTFDGTKGRFDASSPSGLHDTAGGANELVFECADPENTCEPGRPCGCKVLMTPGDGAHIVEWLRLDHRFDDTAAGFGVVGIRCLLSLPESGR